MTTPTAVVTFGEAMALFMADQPGPLDSVGTFHRALAGAEANVASGLARLGHRVAWLGRVGDDPMGRYVARELAAEGVDVAGVEIDPTAPTGLMFKSRTEVADPQIAYVRTGSAGSRLAWTDHAARVVTRAGHLHVTGISLALSASTRDFACRAVEVARAAGATVSFDPNLRPSLWPDQAAMIAAINEIAVRADWVLPGLAEGRLLTGGQAAADIAAFYLDRGVAAVVVKAGAAGATAFSATGAIHQPAFPVTVVDTVGAGDGFAAGLISGHLDGLDLPARLARAAAVAALAVTSRGDKDGLPTRVQLAAFLARTEDRRSATSGPGDGPPAGLLDLVEPPGP